MVPGALPLTVGVFLSWQRYKMFPSPKHPSQQLGAPSLCSYGTRGSSFDSRSVSILAALQDVLFSKTCLPTVGRTQPVFIRYQGLFLKGQSGPDVRLTALFRLVSKLIMHFSIPSPPYALTFIFDTFTLHVETLGGSLANTSTVAVPS